MSVTVKELLGEVQSEILNSSERVVRLVKDDLVCKELNSRKDAVLSVLLKFQEAERDLRKIKPDHEVFDVEGKPCVSAYSKAKLEELKKAKEHVEKLERAISLAIGGDFSKVKELAK